MRRTTLPWVDGVVLLDKPRGISSQKAVTQVKFACQADKAGHTGTLDPLATGLLVVCLGEATKYSQDLFIADKSYIATVYFGVKTDTGDSEGKVIKRALEPSQQFKENLAAQLQLLIPRFRGHILQVPPMYSALKRDGRPLYAYAREGEVFDLAPREVEITELSVMSCTWPLAVIKVSCSKGTYIRSLIADIGDALGCGAHMTQLQRTRIGHLHLAHSQSMTQIVHHAQLMQVDALIAHIPALTVEHAVALRLKMGQRVHVHDILADSAPPATPWLSAPLLRLYYEAQTSLAFMGLVEQKEGVLHPKRLLATDRLEHILGLATPAQTRVIHAVELPAVIPAEPTAENTAANFSNDTSIKHHHSNSLC